LEYCKTEYAKTKKANSKNFGRNRIKNMGGQSAGIPIGRESIKYL